LPLEFFGRTANLYAENICVSGVTNFRQLTYYQLYFMKIKVCFTKSGETDTEMLALYIM